MAFRLSGLLLMALAVLPFTSCAPVPPVDPRFTVPPAAGYDANPPADEIVGMWTHSQTTDNGGNIATHMLFRPDGTGVMKSYSKGYVSADAENILKDKLFPLKWKYEGSGWWVADIEAHFPPSEPEIWTWHYRVTPEPEGGGRRAMYQVQSPIKPGSGHYEYRSLD